MVQSKEERKAKRRERDSTPEALAKRRERNSTPEALAKRRERDSTPEGLAKKAEKNRKRKEQLAADSILKQKNNDSKRKWREENREFKNNSESARRKIDRRTALETYSDGKPHCIYCGETIEVFLNIDHIHGKKSWKHSRDDTGHTLYTWLRQQDYPSGFQVLCYTCNFIKNLKEREKTHSKTKDAIRHRIFNQKLKIEILTHYSKIKKPQCVCCKYDELGGLALDHQEGRINTKHKKGLGGDKLYRWVRNEYQNTDKYPLGLETLCFNCNSGRDKSPEKICPHKV